MNSRIESINARTDSINFNFKCTNLILDCSYAPLEYFESNLPCEKVSRCILITDKSIFPTEDREDNVIINNKIFDLLNLILVFNLKRFHFYICQKVS